ncbi:integrase domain-containing protein [Geomonas subterranea]|uniref:Integrase domain-containing protein n=1 Tax=Geomonas subterranea TaxID=2847989 RepID=A0ABX8LQW3_9BACT|nr:integrase domain-containing protein [Geomonas subterranea]QXE92679.1 integrase domain-containing protein [Geomonas subterranea]QXM09222.1 integrase domain-containing protein [Geomonas subterranea]
MGKHAQKLKHEARGIIGKNWSAASLTREKLLGNLDRIAEFAAAKGYQHISQIGGRFVTDFFEHLKAGGRSPSTISGYATALRTLAAAIGKVNIVPRTNESLGGSRAGTRLQPKEPDIEKLIEVREKLYTKAQWLGIAHDIRAVFGVRAKESLLTRTTFVDARGRTLLQVEGTKGGRPRNLTVDTPEKGSVVAQLREHLAATGGKSLIPARMSLKEAYSFQKNSLHRLGATKANNANAHLARHAYAQALKEAGVDRAAIAQDLGHGRIDVISHYCRK